MEPPTPRPAAWQTATPLPALISDRLEILKRLCQNFGVERLELFGSAASESFNAATSDLDFIVWMRNEREPGYARRFCDFAESLETLYGRKVDLLTERMIRNPIFKAEVDRTRRLLVEI